MDWRKFGFDWNRARAFLVTAEEGSFSAAARALGLAQPTLGRQVSALEGAVEVPPLQEGVGRLLGRGPLGHGPTVTMRAQNVARLSPPPPSR